MNRRDWLLGRLAELAADARKRGDALMTAVWEGLAEEVRRHEARQFDRGSSALYRCRVCDLYDGPWSKNPDVPCAFVVRWADRLGWPGERPRCTAEGSYLEGWRCALPEGHDGTHAIVGDPNAPRRADVPPPPASPAPQGARKTDEGTTVTVWLPEINEGDDPVVRQLVDAALSLAATHTASFSARVEVDGEPVRVVSSLAPPPAAPDPAPGLEYATWEPSAATGDPDGLPDTLIVPVVEELRRRGVVTLQSCQGHVGSSDAHLWFRADLTDEQARSLAATPGMAKVTRMFSPEDCWEAWWVASDRDRAAYEGCVAAILAVASPVAAADDWQSVGPTCPCDLGLPRPDDAGACPAWPNCQQPRPPSAEAATPHAEGERPNAGLPGRWCPQCLDWLLPTESCPHSLAPVSAPAQGVGE